MKNTLALEARYGGGRLELTPVAHPHDPGKAERPTWLAKLTGRGFEGARTAGTFLGADKPVPPGLVAEMVSPGSFTASPPTRSCSATRRWPRRAGRTSPPRRPPAELHHRRHLSPIS